MTRIANAKQTARQTRLAIAAALIAPVPLPGILGALGCNPLIITSGPTGSTAVTRTRSLPVCNTSCPGPWPLTSAEGEKTRRYSNGSSNRVPSSKLTASRREPLRKRISVGVALIANVGGGSRWASEYIAAQVFVL